MNKTKEKNREYCNRWYHKNKKSVAARVHTRRKEKRKWLQNLRSEKGCYLCGETHPACLQFHHTKNNKKYDVSDMVHRGHSKEKILKEIKKCIIVCANCHFKKHWNEQSNGG